MPVINPWYDIGGHEKLEDSYSIHKSEIGGQEDYLK